MDNIKKYDLEARSEKFAGNCKNFSKKLPRTSANIEYVKQLIRSSASQASNYIEANESKTKKEVSYRIRVCRKETKETGLWLRLCDVGSVVIEEERKALINESCELRNIYNSILNKVS